jgi:formylglycine-generating enzyme required for sulfatase activity
MRKRVLLASVVILLTLIYSWSAISEEKSFEVDPPEAAASSALSHPALPERPERVEYSFDRCGLCHEVPEIARRELGAAERQRCDFCHAEFNERVILAAVKIGEPILDIPAPEEKTRGPWEKINNEKPRALGSMAYIPAGEFIQGTNIRHADEGPEHKVYLGGYYIDIYEVTNYEYKRFIDATGYKRPPHWITGTYPRGKKYHPVVYVSMFDADSYCRWAGKRLPIESEWEKGARGTDGRIHPWGNDFDASKGNVVALGIKDTTRVGSFEEGKSPHGLYDMVGNAWEWTSTWFYPYEGSDIPHKDEYYSKKVVTLKGGSWFDCSGYNCGMSAYTFNRSQFSPTIKNNSFGFRCAKDDDRKGAK